MAVDRVMKLGFVSPLPPLLFRNSAWIAGLLWKLSEQAEVRSFVRDPAHVAAEFGDRLVVEPCADLSHRVATGDVELPIYVVVNSAHCAHQVRYISELPGLLLLLDDDLQDLESELILGSGVKSVAGALHDRSRGLMRVQGDEDLDFLTELLLETAAGLLVGSPSRHRGSVMETPRVEILVVSYNSRKIIAPALEAALAQDYPKFQVKVVDNASEDGTAEFIRERFPDVELIESKENLGFAGGNNLGFKESQAGFVALLNQDAIPRRDWLTELVRPAVKDPQVALVGSKMMMLRCPTIFNSTGIAMNRIGFPVDRQIGAKDEDPSPVPEEVFGASGGAVLIRNAALREFGGFDDLFFMYFEDVDLSWRAWLSGWKVLYAPLAVVHHDWHGDLSEGEQAERSDAGFSRKTERRRVLCERNRLLTLVKNYSLGSLLRALLGARRYDRVRFKQIRDAMKRGENPDYFRMVEGAIRGAWRWNRENFRTIWRQRAQTQRLRTVADTRLFHLLSDWVGEPTFIGDLEAINDRFSARANDRLVMGETDGRSLGPGWYGTEPRPDLEVTVRWTKQRAWAYLKADKPVGTLEMLVASGPKPIDLVLSTDRGEVGSRHLEGGVLTRIAYEFEEPLPAGVTHEMRLDCDTFRPCDCGMGPDTRELGAMVAEIRLK
ncbi:MAG: glycosyltransferase family 2 protein [Planctomycetota bacterium]